MTPTLSFTDTLRRHHRILILFIAAFTFLYTKLWEGHFEGDESCYAVLARQVIRSGDWLVLHHPTYEKWSNFYEHPPLNMLLVAVSFKLFGINNHAAKGVSATLAFGTIILTYLIGKTLKNREYGYIAAFILTTTHFFLERARGVFLDVPFAFFLALSFYGVVLALKKQKLIWVFAGGLATALAMLTKGIPAVAVVVTALIGFIGFSGSGKRFFLNTVYYFAGLALVMVPWTWAQFAYDQGRFFDWYLFNQVGPSMAGRGQSTATSPLFYIERLFEQVMVPWFLFAVLGIVSHIKSLKKQKDFTPVLILISAAFILFGFSIVKFRQAAYIIPALPFLALLASDFFITPKWAESFSKWAHRFILFLLFLFIIIAMIFPIPFSSESNTMVPLSPYIDTYTSSMDTILTYSNDAYAIRHMIPWYWDRDQEECEDLNTFVIKWNRGQHTIGVIRIDSQRRNDLPITPTATSGEYALYLNSTGKPLKLGK